MSSISIDAKPTKEFFITMLTRDIPLDRAILDLIDNSVDAANNQMKVEGLDNLEKFNININFSKDFFEITDNCGGFNLETGQKYAFRFGRDIKAPPTPNSVGQFGVGMKRTLFKLGEKFTVKTKSENDSGFIVQVDVNQWKREEEWNFPCEIGNTNLQDGFTSIKVENLYSEIADHFELKDFIDALIHEISLAHFMPLNKNLKITINGEKVPKFDFHLFQNEFINPQVEEKTIDNVSIKVICGLSERDLEKGGWYVVCNGRLILTADKTKLTGWDTDLGTRKYHADFAFFRGIVIFDSVDSSLLPWTTTKTGIDADNKYYKIAFKLMLSSMKKVIPILSDRAKESKYFEDGLIKDQPLNDAIKNSKVTSLLHLSYSSKTFSAPQPNLEKESPSEVRIQYNVPTSQFEKVSQLLETNIKSEVGLKTFQYYFSYECGNE
ncbi:ATP-binding protein [Acinetobacter baumannii]|uniref:ATP-binding protein n=1 Tax=Acinetobacter baumannii TaxID=470 RepID=UPI00389690D7